MGAVNKMLAEIGGKPLVRIAAEQALASRAKPVIVVTGHEREQVKQRSRACRFVWCTIRIIPRASAPRSRAGIAAVPEDAEAAIICLGDMPQVDAALIDKLIAAFDPERGALVVVPSIEGRRGNPVVWSRRFFQDLMQIQGDIGARHLIGNYAEAVVEVPVAGEAALTDVDTPESLSAVKAEIERA